MAVPLKPKAGMRVIYGRGKMSRSGWEGYIGHVCDHTGELTVRWDAYPNDTTKYRKAAWSASQFNNRFRDRDIHYIFFDEDDPTNKQNFPDVFDCGNQKEKFLKKLGSKIMEKVLDKPILVEGKELRSLTVDKLVGLIVELEKKIERYKGIKVSSKKIDALCKETEEAIAETVKELDSRE